MIEVKKVGPDSRNEWNQYIEGNAFAIAWQVYEWSEVVERHYPIQFIPIAAYENGKIVGILPLYSSTTGKKRALISVPFAVAGGILGDNEDVQGKLLEYAVAISRDEGGIPLTLKQYKIRIPGNLKTDENYFNFELPLQGGPEALRNRVNPENLAFAESARRNGLKVEYPAQDISEFYNLLLRHHCGEGVPCASESWIKTLIQFGMYSVAIARIDGRPVAATLVKQFKKTVSFPFSCLAVNARDGVLNCGYGLYWDLINRFAERKFNIFHSGRIPKTQEVLDFRLGWGGTAHPYFYQYHPNTGEKTEFTSRRGLKRKLMTQVWKGLPLPLARRLGPIVVSKFP